ncbi:high-affinity iron permease [Anopheles sinensis]|uniref:High-affinity iron permease n=1 Tax=Anopheles sinensis TaxID=74873 RepID=A0A084VG44_ANOSI|nr:high-affinity iron permease [Anopheles sinensis]
MQLCSMAKAGCTRTLFRFQPKEHSLPAEVCLSVIALIYIFLLLLLLLVMPSVCDARIRFIMLPAGSFEAHGAGQGVVDFRSNSVGGGFPARSMKDVLL